MSITDGACIKAVLAAKSAQPCMTAGMTDPARRTTYMLMPACKQQVCSRAQHTAGIQVPQPRPGLHQPSLCPEIRPRAIHCALQDPTSTHSLQPYAPAPVQAPDPHDVCWLTYLRQPRRQLQGQTYHARSTPEGRTQGKAARVAAQVQDVQPLCQAAYEGSAVSLVAEEACLLARPQVCCVVHPVLQQLLLAACAATLHAMPCHWWCLWS